MVPKDTWISHPDIVAALDKELSVAEVSILAYCSGYFFRRLLGFHTFKKATVPCDVCNLHGEKFTQSSVVQTQSDLFLYFKRFHTDSATLYKCSDHFVDFVQTIIKVTNFCADHILDEDRIVNVVLLSVRKHLSNFPQFCSDDKFDRFVSLVARTMVVYRIKWLNSDLKSKKKFTRGKGKKSKSAKKLDKLTHK